MNLRSIFNIKLLRTINKSLESSFIRQSSSGAAEKLQLKSDTIAPESLKDVIFIQLIIETWP